jgi:eukaryotic-like serine/threonine-protein kinase
MPNKLKPASTQQSRGDETLLQWQAPTEDLLIEPKAIAVSGSRDAAPGAAERPPRSSGAADEPDPLERGDIVGGRYLIEEHISSGSFGAVYRAGDCEIQNHQVALKLLHSPAADEPAREAALRELTLLASVSHPSVVQFKDYGWHEGRLWFAMPWYNGQTLAERCTDANGPVAMQRATARPIFERLAQGLAAMHGVGIHHHDIKPENIFLADIAGFEGGFPVLLDLGIAAQRGEGPKGLTVEYTSPETAATALGVTDKAIGSAADVFSLALVLRNLLDPASAPPQDGEFIALLNQRATVRVKPSRRRDLRHLRAAFERWLSLDPDARPTAAEFAGELALLTRPEEQREARRRILRRVVPIVLASALAVSLLWMQVRQQKTEILVQRERLSQEMLQSEELRQRSAGQLAEIEAKSEQIGTQAQRLQRAIAIGRELNKQLEKAETRADGLTRKLRKSGEDIAALTIERDGLTRKLRKSGEDIAALTTERDGLSRERDELRQNRDRLQRERDDLGRARDALVVERDGLRGDRDRLTGERKDALAERDAMVAENKRIAADLKAEEKNLDKMTHERDDLREQVVELKQKAKEQKRRIRDLEKRRGKTAAVPEPAPE